MLRAAIIEIVPVNRGDDNMVEAHGSDRFGNIFRLVAIKRIWQTGGYIAKSAGAGADFAHDQEGCMLLVPAFADVWTASFLAHRYEAVRPHDIMRIAIAFRRRRLDTDPVRFAQHFLIRLVSLFRMARPRPWQYCRRL